MKLTKDQIKDLESRGIKPGVKLRCCFTTLIDVDFSFQSWKQFEFNPMNNSISSIKEIGWNKNEACYVWLLRMYNYAEPIE